MSEQTLNTRLQLKIDSFANWNKWYGVDGNETTAPAKLASVDFTNYANKGAALVLKRGEVALCEIPTGNDAATTAPTVLFKVGDGENPFCKLNWASALAADVHAWAKKPEAEFLTWLKTENKFLVDTDLTAINEKLLNLDTEGTVTAAIAAAKNELLGGESDTEASATIIGAKKYADKQINDLLKAYITADETEEGKPNAIDKLQEIASWIDGNKDGAADIISDLGSKLDKSVFDNFKTGDFTTVANQAKDYSDNATAIKAAVANAHSHTYTATDTEIQAAVNAKHTHSNSAVLNGITSANIASWNGKLDKTEFEEYQTSTLDPVISKAHTHKNFDLLETYTQTETNLADAVDKKHSHSNQTVLDGITSNKVAAWDGKLDKTTYDNEKANFITDGSTIIINCGSSTEVI